MATQRSTPERPKKQPLMTRDELVQHVRRLFEETLSLSASEIRRAAPKTHQDDVLEIARELASSGELHRVTVGKTERFFKHDPEQTLARLVHELCELGPLTASEIRQRVERAVTGLGALFTPAWLERALRTGALFEQCARSNEDRTKCYATRPDLRLIFKRSLEALEEEMGKSDAARVPRAAVIDFLAMELRARDSLSPASSARPRPSGLTLGASPSDAPPASARRRVGARTHCERLALSPERTALGRTANGSR